MPLASVEECREFGRRPTIRKLGELVQHGRPFLVMVRQAEDLERLCCELMRHGYRILVPWVLTRARFNEYAEPGQVFIVDIEAWNAAPETPFQWTRDGTAVKRSKG